MLVMRSRNQEARERLEESLEIARTIGGASSEEAQALNWAAPWRSLATTPVGSSVSGTPCGSPARPGLTHGVVTPPRPLQPEP